MVKFMVRMLVEPMVTTVNDTCNATDKQACKDVSSDKEDNERHTVNIIGGEQY